ncbi:fumarylacetoacetate hydrolase family protein [Nocardia fluminea]|uniref:fumarylacetoacetate hydrolase family protein n=1 Tax=Nocardia fluminea TaxID=134984 RepID=UPI0033EAF32B
MVSRSISTKPAVCADSAVFTKGIPLSTFGFATLANSSVPAVLCSRGVIALDALLDSSPRDFGELIDRWDEVVELADARLGTPESGDLPWCEPDSVIFAPAGLSRPAIYCAGANYTDHIAEMGGETVERAYHFPTPPRTLNGHGGQVRMPSGATMLDWEVELAVVIGRPARNVDVADALDYILGYTVANDVSVRDPELMYHPIFGIDWMAAKNGEGLTVLGPAVVPARLIEDHRNLDLSLTVNGEIRQQSNTSQMIITVAEQIAALSAAITLEPGDVVLTGTPAGTAAAHGHYLSDGDVMVASVAGIGSIRNTVVS